MSELPPMTPSENPPPPPLPPSAGPAVPWEEPNAGFGSIVPTVAGFITRPIEFFGRMSLTVDLVRPIAYFVILALVGACISQLWSFLLFNSMLEMFRSVAGSQFEKFAPLFHRPGPIQLVLTLVVTPLIALVILFIWSGLVHLVLVLVGGANNGFTTTLRVMCYAQTTQLAGIIPFLGGFFAFFWRLVLEMIGLSQAHKTDGWKAALAVLVPLFLCCACIIAGAAAFGAALVQALQQMK